jgi:hypothetical protein
VVPGSLPPLSEIWELAQQNLRTLPDEFRALRPNRPYPVEFSPGLRALRAEALAEEQSWTAFLGEEAVPVLQAGEPV